MDLKKVLLDAFDWAFPPHCSGCGKPGELICETCLSKVRRVRFNFCSKCGKPLKKGVCHACGETDFNFIQARAPFFYEGAVAIGIKSLKFRRNISLAYFFGELLADYYPGLHWHCDTLIPVPITESRRAARTYNQTELFGKVLAEKIGIPMNCRALAKILETKDQAGLNAEKRRENLINAFQAEPVLVKGKRILLVDDIMTTGSTFYSCTAALLRAGADSVHCLSIATVPYGMRMEPEQPSGAESHNGG